MASEYNKLVNELKIASSNIPDKKYLTAIRKATGAKRIASDDDIKRTFGDDVATTIFTLLDLTNPLYSQLSDLMKLINSSDEPQPEMNDVIKDQIKSVESLSNIYRTIIYVVENSPHK